MKELCSLIEKLNQSDIAAFEEIYKRCSGHITFVCSNFCDNKEDVEEVVQDTFLIVFKKAGALKSETFMTYLRKIAIHESLRKQNVTLRLQNYVVQADDERTESLPELNADFLPEQHLQYQENRAELLEIIKSLPKMQLEMVYMYYYAAFSTTEIANSYNCSTSNVRKTLRNARSTIKAKLEGTDKRASRKGIALVPLATLFFMEEEAFAVSYAAEAAPSITSIAAKTTETFITASIAAKATETFITTSIAAKSIKGYVIAASVAAACTVSVVTYFALQPPGAEEYVYTPYESAYESYTPALAETVEYDEEDIVETVEYNEEYIVETAEYDEEDIAEEALPPEPVALELIPVEEPADEPEPVTIDKTPEILAALAAADNAEAVNGIIGYYGFGFDTQIQDSTELRFRFYVTNEGSGDILIGIATYYNGSLWRMKFEHFPGGQIPTDRTELFRWMEEE